MSAIPEIESLSGLIAFSSAVEARSFAEAARTLGISPSAVSKAINRLETRLGCKLLHRTTRSLEPTPEGLAFHRKVSVLLRDLALAEDSLRMARQSYVGRVKVSVPTVLGRRVIVPALASFSTRYPDIELDLRLDDRKVDLVAEQYDLVLRLGRQQDSGLIGRKLGLHRFVTCAAPAYLESRSPIVTPADLKTHRCIVYRFPTSGQTETWSFEGEPEFHPSRTSLILNDGDALAQAALAGLGTIQVPRYQVMQWLASVDLVEVLSGQTAPRGDAWLIWPPALSGVPRLHAVVQFLAEIVGRAL